MTLEIRDIWKSFPHKRGVQEVLRGVGFTVERGEFVSLIGHSGCGKSTLLSIAGGLLTPDRGEVLLDGELVIGATGLLLDAVFLRLGRAVTKQEVHA